MTYYNRLKIACYLLDTDVETLSDMLIQVRFVLYSKICVSHVLVLFHNFIYLSYLFRHHKIMLCNISFASLRVSFGLMFSHPIAINFL